MREAIDSAKSQTYQDLEIIVVDDGSTHPITQKAIRDISDPEVRIISQKNLGLAAARNTGIRAATGKYILPLDSDDRIAPTYVEKAVGILDTQPEVGLVYCLVDLFGEKQGLWEVAPYSFPEILIEPQIFASALYRKSDWEEVGGYKSDMIYGWEDYEFWLSLIEKGLKVHRIQEVLFFYRQSEGSMAKLDRTKMLYSFKKLFEHHPKLYTENISVLFNAVIESKPYRDRNLSRETFELYLPSSGGHLPENTFEYFYSVNTWSRVTFQVSARSLSEDRKIRLDPGQRMGIYDIATVKLFNPATHQNIFFSQTTKDFESFAMGGDAVRLNSTSFLRILSIGNDPYLYLPNIVSSDQPLMLEVWVKYHPNLEVLKDGVELSHTQNDHLAKLSDLQEQLDRYHVIEQQQQQHIQNLQNEKTVLQSELNNLQGTAKSIQAELIALQAKYEALVQKEKSLRDELNESCRKVKNKGLFQRFFE